MRARPHFRGGWAEFLALTEQNLHSALALVVLVSWILVSASNIVEGDQRWWLVAASIMFLAFAITRKASGQPSAVSSGSEPLPASRPTPDPPGTENPITPDGESEHDLQVKLRQLESHRSDYVATVSHELRTPLTSIKGFAQLLTRDQRSGAADIRRYAQTIATEADKLAHIVDDIVELTRMESDILALHRHPLSLANLILVAVQGLQPMLLSKPIELNLPEQVPQVRGDPEMLGQALRRLLMDALRRSAPQDAIKLALRVEREGVRVELEYRTTEDQIRGLARDLEMLCIAVEGDEATRLGHGGVDLYICRNLIAGHGGRMWVESPREGVARVAFTLPY